MRQEDDGKVKERVQTHGILQKGKTDKLKEADTTPGLSHKIIPTLLI